MRGITNKCVLSKTINEFSIRISENSTTLRGTRSRGTICVVYPG